ncbi:hypothetical protein F5884DRAFT_856903 [Xylogone sp. PMI_703]|nr:hypothetical protein F5884DRAFT_856903 [Xylogone sp. PMI_703]
MDDQYNLSGSGCDSSASDDDESCTTERPGIIIDGSGRQFNIWILLDSGSARNFISRGKCQSLSLIPIPLPPNRIHTYKNPAFKNSQVTPKWYVKVVYFIQGFSPAKRLVKLRIIEDIQGLDDDPNGFDIIIGKKQLTKKYENGSSLLELLSKEQPQSKNEKRGQPKIAALRKYKHKKDAQRHAEMAKQDAEHSKEDDEIASRLNEGRELPANSHQPHSAATSNSVVGNVNGVNTNTNAGDTSRSTG